MVKDAAQIRDALVRQWRAIAATLPGLDLAAPSRIEGWRNREVVAHLSVQPPLLARFLRPAEAVVETMRARHLDLEDAAKSLAPLAWVDQATGRTAPTEPFVGVLPVTA